MLGIGSVSELPLSSLPEAGGGPTIASATFSFVATSTATWDFRSISGMVAQIVATGSFTGNPRAITTGSVNIAATALQTWSPRAITRGDLQIIAGAVLTWDQRAVVKDSASIVATALMTWDGLNSGGGGVITPTSFDIQAVGAFNPDAKAIGSDAVSIQATSLQTWDGTDAAIIVAADFSMASTSEVVWVGENGATITRTYEGKRVIFDFYGDDEELFEIASLLAFEEDTWAI